VRRIITPDNGGTLALAAGPSLAAIAPGSAGVAAAAIESVPPMNSQTAQMIDMAQVQGQVHAQSVQKVAELAERNPHETVAVIRQWLQDV